MTATVVFYGPVQNGIFEDAFYRSATNSFDVMVLSASSLQMVVQSYDTGNFTTYSGTGFTFNGSGIPTGGTVSGFTIKTPGNSTIISLSGVNWALVDMHNAVSELLNNNNGAPLTSLFSAQRINLNGYNASESISFDFSGVTSVIDFGGTPFDDLLTGGEDNDILLGEAGNDTLFGGNGDDQLDGGVGNDSLLGGNGNDYLIGGSGNDYLNPGENNEGWDSVDTGAGNDTVDFGQIVLGGVGLDHWKLGAAINATVDGDANTGSINKGSNGTTTLIDVSNPMAWWGLGLNGTIHNDTYNITLGTDQWISVSGSSGSNVINILGGTGTVRLNYGSADYGLRADLSTGIFGNGYGGYDVVTGLGSGPRVEFHGSYHSDQITGSNAGESFILAAGDDTLAGGGGFDRLRYDRFGVTAVTVDLEIGTATGKWGGQSFTHTISEIEEVRGSRDDGDTLIGDGNANKFDGRGGDDTLIGAGGDDTLIGNSGSDVAVFNVAIADATISGSDGNVTVVSSEGTDVVEDVEYLQFTDGVIDTATMVLATGPTATSDSIVGTVGNDSLTGLSGDDTLIGNAGNDTLRGGDGFDHLFGGAGNDLLDPGDNYRDWDDVTPGAGNDTVDFSNMTSDGGGGILHDDLSAAIIATVNGDANTGSVFKGTNGATTILNVNTPLQGWGFAIGGTDFNDIFNVDLGSNWGWMQVMGGDGVDTFNLNPGSGIIRLSFYDTSATSGVWVNLSTGTIGNDGFGNIEMLTGWVSELRTTDGNDYVIGTSDDDRFILQGGNDTLDGGAGVDVLRYDRDGVEAVSVNLATGVATGIWGGSAFNHAISNIENVSGSRGGDDLLVGNGSDNFFALRKGDDTVDGGDGNDTVSIRVNSTDAGIVRDGSRVTVTSSQGTDVLNNIEHLNFWDTSIEVSTLYSASTTPTAGDDQLFGTAGDNSLNGLAGHDYFEGYAGNDTLIGSNGNDAMYGGMGNDRLLGGNGFDTLWGQAGDDYINPGNSAAYNGGGYDSVRAGTGNDTVDFGKVTDGFIELSHRDLSAGVVANIDGNTNTATVNKGVNGTTTILDVEKPMMGGAITFTSTHLNDVFNMTVADGGLASIWLNGGSNTINLGTSTGAVRIDYRGATSGVTADLSAGAVSDNGLGGSDTISNAGTGLEFSGSHHADSIIGSNLGEWYILNGGHDTLDGQGGSDLLRYDRSDVGPVHVDLNTGLATGNWNGDLFTHYISNIEDLRGSLSGNDTLFGNASANSFEGKGGNDTLLGRNGNDTLLGEGGNDSILGGNGFDVINGGGGADTLKGGEGNDTVDGGDGKDEARLGNGADVFNDNAQGGDFGKDTVFGGNGNDTINGGAGNDEFRGEVGNDSILGGDGADKLFGGGGADILKGGKGNDTVDGGDGKDKALLGNGFDVFNDNAQGGDAGKDTVYGGNGNDKINGGAGNDQFWGDAGNDSITGGNGFDKLYGGANADTLKGGAGNDTLTGGAGQDQLTGGAGNDRFVFADGFGNDTIFGLESADGEDINLVNVTGITDFTDLVNNHLVDNGGIAQIEVGSNSILLDGVNFSDVGVGQLYSADDFIF